MNFQLTLSKETISLFIVLHFFGQSLFAQTFTKERLSRLFEGESVAFSDVDNDGDEDVFISGSKGSKLYTNDGTGKFSETMETAIEGVSLSSVGFSDVDGDGDEDVLITGWGSQIPIAKLYINDGTGAFIENTGTPFEGVYEGALAFSDIDNDGDEDVLITGIDSSFSPISKLYINDGMGTFSEVTGTPFEGVLFSSIGFSDVDGDGDEDLLITGWGSQVPIAKLYTNDGMGTFTEIAGTPFEGIYFGSLAFSDVDGDGDQDVLIAGLDSSISPISKLYTNDGTGTFYKVFGTPFQGGSASSVGFSDVDGDGDQDVFITGEDSSFISFSHLYTNDGAGNFSEALGPPLEGVWGGSLDFSDVDKDGDIDILIAGDFYGNSWSPSYLSAILYTNDGAGNFKSPFELEGVWNGSLACSDVDGDGDEDVLIAGQSNTLVPIVKLYTNNGTGKFSEELNTPFEALYNSSLAFSDIDNDGDEDVLITGGDSSQSLIAKLYINDGMGSFSEIIGTPFVGVYNGSLAFSDVDGDGDEDFLLIGEDSSYTPIVKLYFNDGMGSFIEAIGTPFRGVSSSSLAFSDVDNDGDGDVLIIGEDSSHVIIAVLYINDGTGSFSEITSTPFEGVNNGSMAFSDVDGDGDEDVLITGIDSSYIPISKLYTNDGMGTFSEATGTPFLGVGYGSLAFSDVDNDGDEDVFITGKDSSNVRIAKLYTNDGVGNFTEATPTPFEGVGYGSLDFADLDGDGDEDILITGAITDPGRFVFFVETVVNMYVNESLRTSISEPLTPYHFDFSIFPNPAIGNYLNIRSLPKTIGVATVKVFDLNGRLMIQQRKVPSLSNKTLMIDISDLSKGTYIIRIDDGLRMGVGKFVVL